MTEQPQLQREPQLGLRSQLNHNYLLENQILTFQKATLATEFSKEEVTDAIRGLWFLIPDVWKDKDFDNEIDVATSKEKIDKRPIVAGRIRMDEAICRELGIEPFEMKAKIDYWLILQACINLLTRRKKIGKVDRIEKLEGIELDRADLEKGEIWKSDILNK